MDDFEDVPLGGLGPELNKQEIVELIKNKVWKNYLKKLNLAANQFINLVITNNPEITLEEISDIIRPACLNRAVFEEYIFASSPFKAMVNKILFDIMSLGHSYERLLEIELDDYLDGLFEDTFQKTISKEYLRSNLSKRDNDRKGHRLEANGDNPIEVTITLH